MPTTPPPAYSPGLEGVIAGESAICFVDPKLGLRYRGYDVEKLAESATFEQVAWLLLRGELPNDNELADFTRQIGSDAVLPKEFVELLRKFPANMRTMDLIRSGVSLLASFDPDLGLIDHDANLRKSVRIIARLTTLTTTGWRIANRQEVVQSDVPDLAGRFLAGLNGRRPEPWQVRAMNTVFILYAEHEFNASTFSARVTASTLADIYPSIVAAIGTLEGPLHGGANEQAMTMIESIGNPAAAEAWLMARLSRREKIMGFGHRVYKAGDSRVPAMRKLLEFIGKQTGQTQWLDICLKLEEVMQREKGLFSNLDLYAAPVLKLLEIPSALNTPVFACARAAGWCAHVIEQQDHNRLLRPRCLYTGPAPR